MSLADALGPQLSQNVPFNDAYLGYEAEQPPPIDQDEEMDDLFDEDAVVDQVERNASPSDGGQADTISDVEQRHREAMEYAEEDDEPDQDEVHALLEQRTEASASLPNVPSPRSSDGQNWVVKIPNFVKVDSKPFHPETYIGPDQEDEELAGTENTRESSMSIKLKVENTLRWRWEKDKDGNYQRQSNSRIIRWSDGSLSLLLGKELFDISQQLYASLGNTQPTMSGSQPSQSQTEPSQHSQSTAKNQGLTYLVAQHKRAEILQSEALVTGYMQLRPTGMQSETHRMLVRAVGQKHSKVARLRMAPDPTQDPEKEKLELMKQTSKSRPKRQKTEDDGFGNPRTRRKSHPRKRGGDGVWSDDEEAAYDMYGGESDEDQDLDGGPGRRTGRKGGARSSGDARKGGEYQTDDFVVSDSPSDDGDSESGKKSKRKRADRGQSDEDDLDKLEAKIEQQEEAERNRGKGDVEEDDHPEPEEMDVESEEPDEDDEHQVRKAGGKRRRLVADFDEEEG